MQLTAWRGGIPSGASTIAQRPPRTSDGVRTDGLCVDHRRGRPGGYPGGVNTVHWAWSRLAARGGDVLVVALVAVAVAERLVVGHGVAAALLAGLWALPLLWRRRWPLLAPSGAMLLMAATLLLAPPVGRDTGAQLAILLVAVWLLTAHNPPRRAAWALPVAIVAVVAVASGGDEHLVVGVATAGAGVAGALYRRDRAETFTWHALNARLEGSRDAELHAAAEAERARIARELHDIVAHSVSVMTVHAAAARLRLRTDPSQAGISLAAVEDASRTALADLDRLVGVLDADEDVDVSRGLADAETLVAHMRDADLDVRLSVAGEPRALTGGLDLALFRILQEALTNALRHAGSVRTDVEVRYQHEAVRLRVTNDLPPPGAVPAVPASPAATTQGRGHGLIGIQERVAVYGGHVEFGARRGRFVVDVRVPTRRSVSP